MFVDIWIRDWWGLQIELSCKSSSVKLEHLAPSFRNNQQVANSDAISPVPCRGPVLSLYNLTSGQRTTQEHPPFTIVAKAVTPFLYSLCSVRLFEVLWITTPSGCPCGKALNTSHDFEPRSVLYLGRISQFRNRLSSFGRDGSSDQLIRPSSTSGISSYLVTTSSFPYSRQTLHATPPDCRLLGVVHAVPLD